MFCSNCGQKLSDNAKFCSSCGRKTNPQAIDIQEPVDPAANQSFNFPPTMQNPAQQPVQSTSEQVLLVLQTNRKFSMFKMTPCYVIFMPDKIVLAYMTKERQKAENDRLSREIKASGKGFFKGSATMMSYWSNYYKRYYEMTSRQILAEDPDNMMIYNNHVSRVLFHAYYNDIARDGSQRSTGGKLSISLASGESLDFSHSIGNIRSNRDALDQLFGGRLKYKT